MCMHILAMQCVRFRFYSLLFCCNCIWNNLHKYIHYYINREKMYIPRERNKKADLRLTLTSLSAEVGGFKGLILSLSSTSVHFACEQACQFEK